MKKLLVATALLGTLALGACATNPDGSTSFDATKLAAVEAQVQAATATACSFVPTIGTVASIIAGSLGAGATVDIAASVAKSICDAVTPAKKQLRGGARTFGASEAPIVNGVVVHGYFLR